MQNKVPMQHTMQAQDAVAAQDSEQLYKNKLCHFIDIEGLPKNVLMQILQNAMHFFDENGQIIQGDALKSHTVVNLFFENSTRTRTTFEIAQKYLGAHVISLDIAHSSTKKGESLVDTMHNLQYMGADAFVVRHNQSGAAHFLATKVCPNVAIINAGDGQHAHPTQAMLDMLTIYRKKGGFKGLKVAIVGDIKHSRVARSDILALQTLGVDDIRVCAPKTLLPTGIEQFGVSVHHCINKALDSVDVVMSLRIQNERIGAQLLPSTKEYFNRFGINEARLQWAKKDAIVMHPGPINRGVEICSTVADGAQSVILPQVTNGIAIRMAVLQMSIEGQRLKRTAL